MNRQLIALTCVAMSLFAVGCTAPNGNDDRNTEPSASGEENLAPEDMPEAHLPSDDDVAEFLDASCADIVSANVASTLQNAGWTAEAKSPWELGDSSLSEGMLCEWTSAEGEPAQYGWALGSTSEVSEVMSWLEGLGWPKQIVGPDTVFTAPDSSETYMIHESGQIRYSNVADGATAVKAP